MQPRGSTIFCSFLFLRPLLHARKRHSGHAQKCPAVILGCACVCFKGGTPPHLQKGQKLHIYTAVLSTGSFKNVLPKRAVCVCSEAHGLGSSQRSRPCNSRHKRSVRKKGVSKPLCHPTPKKSPVSPLGEAVAGMMSWPGCCYLPNSHQPSSTFSSSSSSSSAASPLWLLQQGCRGNSVYFLCGCLRPEASAAKMESGQLGASDAEETSAGEKQPWRLMGSPQMYRTTKPLGS